MKPFVSTRGSPDSALQTSRGGRVYRLSTEVQTCLQPAGTVTAAQDDPVCSRRRSQPVFSVLQGKLRDHIQNPSAVDLVHFLFTPLRMVGVNPLLAVSLKVTVESENVLIRGRILVLVLKQ